MNKCQTYVGRLYLAFTPKVIQGKEFFELLAIFSNGAEARKFKAKYNRQNKWYCFIISKKTTEQVKEVNVHFTKDRAKCL